MIPFGAGNWAAFGTCVTAAPLGIRSPTFGMSEAVDSQPEGLNVMLVNRIAGRSRQVRCHKDTHAATTGSMPTLEVYMSNLQPRSWAREEW